MTFKWSGGEAPASTPIADWKPPFCSIDSDLDCPKCKAKGSVQVREQDRYSDGFEIDAYCLDCHAMLQVTAHITVEFTDPEEA